MALASNNHVEHVVTAAAKREDARVTFPGVGIYSGPVGTPLMAYVKAAFPPERPEHPIIAGLVDSELRELTFPIERDVTVRPINLHNSDGHRIYRRSLVFLMTTAAVEVLPGVKIEVMHSLTSGGFYCEVLHRSNFSEDELTLIRTRMREIVAEDAPIVRKHMPLEEARAMFKARGDDDKVRLLEYREKDYLTVYALHDNIDYFFGYMAANTGVMQLFDLLSSGQGFILQYPRPEAPSSLSPYKESKQLESIFYQTEKWLDVMGIEDVGQLNEAIKGGRIREEILIAEALQTRHLSEIAAAIAERHAHGTRLVLIAGPSSAGKTTFSKRLAVQLMAYGIQPYALGLDNYFVDREFTPRDSSGEYDFEALEALNLDRLNRDLLDLMQRQQVQLPRFDFRLGKSLPGDVIELTNDHIIIAEGIHGLNPELIKEVPHERFFRVYVSALTALNIDRHNRIPTTDVRLIRRIVRDAQHRGYNATDTLDRWESVRRGEKRNIFPYQEHADIMFNSSLIYELAVLRPLVEPLLLQVDRTSPRYVEVKRLLAFLGWVRPASPDYVPGDSLLREFIGQSVLEDYVPGLRQNGLKPLHAKSS